MSEHPSFEDLSAYFDGEEGALASHVDSCEACRETLSSLKADRQAIRAAWVAPAMPKDLLDPIAHSAPWWHAFIPELRVPLLATAAACAALLLWSRGADWFGPRVEIPADLFVAAHNQYELTLPLAPTERILTEMPRGLALGFDPDQEKDSGVY